MTSIDSRIAEGLEESLPQLQTLVLVNNSIEELVRYTHRGSVYVIQCFMAKHAYMQSDLDPLASLHNLTYLRYIFLFGNYLSKLSSCVIFVAFFATQWSTSHPTATMSSTRCPSSEFSTSRELNSKSVIQIHKPQ